VLISSSPELGRLFRPTTKIGGLPAMVTRSECGTCLADASRQITVAVQTRGRASGDMVRAVTLDAYFGGTNPELAERQFERMLKTATSH
jgi:hypothetical protein